MADNKYRKGSLADKSQLVVKWAGQTTCRWSNNSLQFAGFLGIHSTTYISAGGANSQKE